MELNFSVPSKTHPDKIPASCTIGTGFLFEGGVKDGQGVALTTHHLITPRLCIGRATTVPFLCAFMACYRVIFAVFPQNFYVTILARSCKFFSGNEDGLIERGM
jgi:hypothetical protein